MNSDQALHPVPTTDITRILDQVCAGNEQAAEHLLPLLYQELRKLAAGKLACEQPGQTLQATALVHEAYCRLVGPSQPHWNSRAHFFGAAAEAMRRILVERARRRKQLKQAGTVPVESLPDLASPETVNRDRILDVDAALDILAARDARAAEIVKLHFFAGLSLDEVAQALEISRATVFRDWAYARAQLKVALQDGTRKA